MAQQEQTLFLCDLLYEDNYSQISLHEPKDTLSFPSLICKGNFASLWTSDDVLFSSPNADREACIHVSPTVYCVNIKTKLEENKNKTTHNKQKGYN